MVGYGCTNHVQGILGDTMKFEDIKVGDVVTTTGCVYHGDYAVVDIRGRVIVLDVQEPTDSCWNTHNKDTLWAVELFNIEKIIDPEEDLIVWGALEVGEHFKFNQKDSKECVKITPWAYVVLGYTSINVFYGSTSYKVKLI